MLANQQRYRLYRDYISEIEEIIGAPFNESKQEQKQWCTDYLQADYSTWIDITYDGKIVGFLIITQAPECHPDCDYFIAQSFVSKDFRRKHLMSNAVYQYVTTHKGCYCLDILNANTFAYDFWFKMFKDLGYKPINLKDIKSPFDIDVTTYGFTLSQ